MRASARECAAGFGAQHLLSCSRLVTKTLPLSCGRAINVRCLQATSVVLVVCPVLLTVRRPCSSDKASYVTVMLLAAIRGGSRGYRPALLSRPYCLCQVPACIDDRWQTHPVAAVRLPLASNCTRPLLKEASFAEVVMQQMGMRCHKDLQ